MATFSEVVDAVIDVTKRHDMLSYTVAQVNLVVQDLSSLSDADIDLEVATVPVPPHYVHNFDNFPSDCNSPFKVLGRPSIDFEWTIPHDFRRVRTVKYGGPDGQFIKNLKPGRVQLKVPAYYYQAGRSIHFIGAREPVEIAYYKSPRMYKYRACDKRLIKTLDDTYVVRSNVSTDYVPYQSGIAWHEAIYTRHINWVLDEYSALVITGAASRVLNATGNLKEGGRMHQQYSVDKRIVFRTSGHEKETEL